jgi:hypothetical protein
MKQICKKLKKKKFTAMWDNTSSFTLISSSSSPKGSTAAFPKQSQAKYMKNCVRRYNKIKTGWSVTMLMNHFQLTARLPA